MVLEDDMNRVVAILEGMNFLSLQKFGDDRSYWTSFGEREIEIVVKDLVEDSDCGKVSNKYLIII